MLKKGVKICHAYLFVLYATNMTFLHGQHPRLALSDAALRFVLNHVHHDSQ